MRLMCAGCAEGLGVSGWAGGCERLTPASAATRLMSAVSAPPQHAPTPTCSSRNLAAARTRPRWSSPRPASSCRRGTACTQRRLPRTPRAACGTCWRGTGPRSCCQPPRWAAPGSRARRLSASGEGGERGGASTGRQRCIARRSMARCSGVCASLHLQACAAKARWWWPRKRHAPLTAAVAPRRRGDRAGLRREALGARDAVPVARHLLERALRARDGGAPHGVIACGRAASGGVARASVA